MDIGQLKLFSITFELRYPPAYRLWDSAGRIWLDASKRWPELKVKQGQPWITNFTWKNAVDLVVALDNCHVTSAGRNVDEEEFLQFSEAIERCAKETLLVQKFTRVGLRTMYGKRCGSAAEAAELLLSTGMLKHVRGKHFGIDGAVRLPEVVTRLEDNSLGCMVHLAAQTRKISMDPPVGDRDLELVDKEVYEFIFDCDYYTIAEAGAGQLKSTEWVKQAHHLIRRDSKAFLSGA